MKVALASYLWGPEMAAGAVVAAQRLAHGLCQSGDDVVVISTGPEARLWIEQTAGMTVYRFRPRNLYWVQDKDSQPPWKKVLWQLGDVWNAHAFHVVRRILEEERPDVLHVHKLRGLSPAVWSAADGLGIPIVQTCHDYELMSPEGTLTGRVGDWASRGAWPLRWYSWLRSRWSGMVAAVTAPSQYVLGVFRQRGFFSQAHWQVIPNSHGKSVDEVRKLGLPAAADSADTNPELRVLYLGRVEHNKGVDLLCAAFARCAESFPGIRLDIAGAGTLQSSLRQQYASHRQIAFHGLVTGAKKDDLIAGADALVLPSTWPEVFGLAIVEGYACGKPAVVANVGGMPELVRDGETGMIVPTGDAGALASVLARCSRDPTMLRRMSPACFLAAEAFAEEVVTERHRRLYARVVGGVDG